MEFVNLTPFGALAYRGVDAHEREFNVFAMRTVYKLLRIGHAREPATRLVRAGDR